MAGLQESLPNKAVYGLSVALYCRTPSDGFGCFGLGGDLLTLFCFFQTISRDIHEGKSKGTGEPSKNAE